LTSASVAVFTGSSAGPLSTFFVPGWLGAVFCPLGRSLTGFSLMPCSAVGRDGLTGSWQLSADSGTRPPPKTRSKRSSNGTMRRPAPIKRYVSP
jgi:hypothetical protein